MFDVKAYKEAACNTLGCFNFAQKPDTKAAVKAAAWIEGEKPPKVGDTVDIYDSTNPSTPKSVVLTAENYACSLYDWLKLKTFNCFDGEYSKNLWFFPNDPNIGLRNATRPDWESKYETIDDEEMAWPISVSATTRFNLNLLENQCWYNQLIRRKPRLSFINFLDNGVEVLPYGTGRGQFESVIKKGSYALEDPKTTTSGMIEVFQRGKEAPCFYKCDDEDFSSKIQEVAKFTYNKKDAIATGLTAAVCGTKSACTKYDAIANTAFTYQLRPEQSAISTCLSTHLLDACGEKLAPALLSLITVDESTGLLSAPTGLPSGEYGFTLIDENECCVSGSTCISITVK